MRRRRKGYNEPNIGLTSMLDLIFNVLAFFIITFSPPFPESDFNIELPPPSTNTSSSDNPIDSNLEPEILQSVIIEIKATANGEPMAIRVGGSEVKSMKLLAGRIESFVQAAGGTKVVDSAIINASEGLKYQYVMVAVEACYRAGVTSIGFGDR